MTTLNKTQEYKLDSLVIPVVVSLDEVVDFNEEHGNEENSIKGICVNVSGTINRSDFFGQVQWDSQNNEYSADCDGNALYSEMRKALITNFSDEMFEEYDFSDNPQELRSDLINDVLPKIVKFVCDFAESHADAYRNV